MQHILSFTPEEFSINITSMGEKTFRAKQILDWIYKKNKMSLDEMQNIPKELRDKLIEHFDFSNFIISNKSVSQRDKTTKYLYSLSDGLQIETVKIYAKDRITLCLSSQAGCPYNCSFCATGKMGLKRDLEVHEILGQIISSLDEKEKLTNIVFMGMGEPFANYDNVLKSIKIINSADAMNFGARRITISTCGLADKIEEFAKEGLEVNLAISLNAADNKTRSSLMPINNKFNISRVIAAVNEYIRVTNRRVTFEYVMLEGINDDINSAVRLATILNGLLCSVNLIVYNQTLGEYIPSDKKTVVEFQNILTIKGINSTIRKSAGSDIAAACGQLAVI